MGMSLQRAHSKCLSEKHKIHKMFIFLKSYFFSGGGKMIIFIAINVLKYTWTSGGKWTKGHKMKHNITKKNWKDLIKSFELFSYILLVVFLT